MSSPVDPAVLLDSMAEGMYVVDTRRSITFWNASAQRIAGYDAEQVAGRFCGDGLLNHVDESGASMCGASCPLRATLADGRTRHARSYLHHEAGHLVPVRVTAVPLRDDSGTIVGAIETFTDDSAMVATLQQLRRAEALASLDALTGTGNRRHLEGCLVKRLADWSRDGRSFGVLMIDLDHFKTINDRFDHAAGDAVLRIAAQSIHATLRAGDDVARYGGDEFVVLTAAATTDDLVRTADRLRAVVAASRYPDRIHVRVSASVGGALVRAGDTEQAILARADRSLLEAKSNGRDAAVVAA